MSSSFGRTALILFAHVNKITLNIPSSSNGATIPSHHLLDEKTLRFLKKTLTEAYGNAVQVKVDGRDHHEFKNQGVSDGTIAVFDVVVVSTVSSDRACCVRQVVDEVESSIYVGICAPHIVQCTAV
jgi:hypothetical protein